MKYEVGQKLVVVGNLPKEYSVHKVGDIVFFNGYDKGFNGKDTILLKGGTWIYLECVEPVLETRFKVGDTVRIKEGWGNYGKLYDEVITTIKSIVGRQSYKIWDIGKTDFWYAKEKDLELVEEPQSKTEERVKPGTKVRVVKCSVNSHKGTIGIVQEKVCNPSLGKNNHYHLADEDGKHVCCADKVEIISDTPEPTHPNKCGFMGCQVYYPMREKSDGRIFRYIKAGDMVFGNERYLAKWDDSSPSKFEEESEVNNKIMAVTIGEKYIPKNPIGCGLYETEPNPAYIIITEILSSRMIRYDIYDKNGNKTESCNCFTEDDLEPYPPIGHKKGLMKTLSIMAAKLVDSDVKAFVEAGILDSELTITEVGRDFVLTQVLNDNKTKYATEARKVIAEEKKTKEGK